ncbi:hypothetical protein VTI74DRAFT_4300 [Chaetomium olivicolor]
MPRYLVDYPDQTGATFRGPEHGQDIEPGSQSPTRQEHGPGLSSKLRRQRVKVVSALKSLTNSSGNPPAATEQEHNATGVHRTKSVLASGINKMSNAIFRGPLEPTVVRRDPPKGRPPLKGTFPAPPRPPTPSRPVHTTNSNASSSKTSSSNITPPKTPHNSTGKTSLDSAFVKDRDPNTSSSTFRARHTSPQRPGPLPPPSQPNYLPPSPPDSTSTSTPLFPIRETPRCSPSIVTAERAAAAKIFLETHFNKLLASGPSPRQMRQQMLETELFNRSRQRGAPLSPAEVQAERERFCRRESEYLRELRGVKVRGVRGLVGGKENRGGDRENGYETVKNLGKGSFGVVRLVRGMTGSGKVFAMKVIKKSKMLRSSQEGHLRAERDILVASEGSRWIVPLVASFQDISNLYLVMEYMPGGDFLSLLIREDTLHESVARFYVAEIILCVEAVHSLKCIHRDIKPDNFLVSATGHLKISDFGLAFDGHWSHDTAYYNSHR